MAERGEVLLGLPVGDALGGNIEGARDMEPLKKPPAIAVGLEIGMTAQPHGAGDRDFVVDEWPHHVFGAAALHIDVEVGRLGRALHGADGKDGGGPGVRLDLVKGDVAVGSVHGALDRSCDARGLSIVHGEVGRDAVGLRFQRAQRSAELTGGREDSADVAHVMQVHGRKCESARNRECCPFVSRSADRRCRAIECGPKESRSACPRCS